MEKETGNHIKTKGLIKFLVPQLIQIPIFSPSKGF